MAAGHVGGNHQTTGGRTGAAAILGTPGITGIAIGDGTGGATGRIWGMPQGMTGVPAICGGTGKDGM
jgi:hypothetical protein